MRIETALAAKRADLEDAWITAIFGTYPLDTAGFLRKSGDQFTNPVAHRTREAVPRIVDALLKETLDTDDLAGEDGTIKTGPLDQLIRVRAVQEFSPGQAVAVIFFLKSAVRKLLAGELAQDPALAGELLRFESKIDSLALLSFDVYCACQEQVYRLRVEEVKRGQASLLRRAGLLLGDGETG